MEDILLGIYIVLVVLLAISISNGMAWGNRYHAAQSERIAIHQRLYEMQQERIDELENARIDGRWL